MNKKLRVAVVFGGRSGEHEVSLISAASIIQALDPEKYHVIPVAITKEGRWLTAKNAARLSPQQILQQADQTIALLADPTHRALLRLDDKMQVIGQQKIDVVFPVLHGTYGEDGTIQGLLEMADIPYVGCGVLASAAGMDKDVMKRLFRAAGLPIVRYLMFTRIAWEQAQNKLCRQVFKDFKLPVFVKPANLGSSVGVTKVKTRSGLIEAVNRAAQYDRKILVEEAIEAREVEVSVLGNEQPMASVPGEIIPGAEFYDYDDKYKSDAAQLIIPAKLSRLQTKTLQQYAIRAFQAIDGSGMARVDFFIEKTTGRILVNEINTIPGFTSISMYPKLWAASGIPYCDLVDRLIQLALERHREKSRSRTSR
ncbi:MAG: D-alanine--D-alanine ligase family protein [Acidobacteriota bacterium]|nr:D-alanine--D-alanine ligase [Blastocatellia bacterium]MDW8240416.1 D-alanine--D-alanine ligase family protein [Acidobacteriota bacterium]